jgi:uncharacterized protein
MIEITSEIKELIENNVLALASIDNELKPNVIAVAYVKVIDSNKLLITDNFMNKTRKNILENKSVSVAVWDEKQENSYQLKGKVEYLTEGKWKDFVNQMEENKGLTHKAAVLMTVNEIWNLSEPSLICKET